MIITVNNTAIILLYLMDGILTMNFENMVLSNAGEVIKYNIIILVPADCSIIGMGGLTPCWIILCTYWYFFNKKY